MSTFNFHRKKVAPVSNGHGKIFSVIAANKKFGFASDLTTRLRISASLRTSVNKLAHCNKPLVFSDSMIENMRQNFAVASVKRNWLQADLRPSRTKPVIGKRDLSADFNMPQGFAVLPNFSSQKLGDIRVIKVEEIYNAFSYVDLFKFSCKNAVGGYHHILSKTGFQRNQLRRACLSDCSASEKPQFTAYTLHRGLALCRAALKLGRNCSNLAFINFCIDWNILPKNLSFGFSSLTNLWGAPSLAVETHRANVKLLNIQKNLLIDMQRELHSDLVNLVRKLKSELEHDTLTTYCSIAEEICAAFATCKINKHHGKIQHLLSRQPHLCVPPHRVLAAFDDDGKVRTGNAHRFNLVSLCQLNHCSLSIVNYMPTNLFRCLLNNVDLAVARIINDIAHLTPNKDCIDKRRLASDPEDKRAAPGIVMCLNTKKELPVPPSDPLRTALASAVFANIDPNTGSNDVSIHNVGSNSNSGTQRGNPLTTMREGPHVQMNNDAEAPGCSRHQTSEAHLLNGATSAADAVKTSRMPREIRQHTGDHQYVRQQTWDNGIASWLDVARCETWTLEPVRDDNKQFKDMGPPAARVPLNSRALGDRKYLVAPAAQPKMPLGLPEHLLVTKAGPRGDIPLPTNNFPFILHHYRRYMRRDEARVIDALDLSCHAGLDKAPPDPVMGHKAGSYRGINLSADLGSQHTWRELEVRAVPHTTPTGEAVGMPHVSVRQTSIAEFFQKTKRPVSECVGTGGGGTRVVEPAQAEWLLDIGNRFSLPIASSSKGFLHDIDVAVLRSIYAVRYASRQTRDAVEMADMKLNVPFEPIQPRLPDAIHDSPIDRKLDQFRQRLLLLAKKEFENFKKSNSGFIELVSETKKSLGDAELVVVDSDKTKRNVILPHDTFMNMCVKFVNESPDYLLLRQSNAEFLLKRANKLVSNVLPKIRPFVKNPERCLCSNADGAKLFFNIKDHKKPDVTGNFPLRPIASVHGTPVDGIDWILQQVLSKAAKKVPANLRDANEIAWLCHGYNANGSIDSTGLCSLDVVNLYPNVDTKRYTRMVAEFAVEALGGDARELLGLDCADLRRLLDFVCEHYEVRLNDKYYLQKFGVPMGARFAPPFAIIVLHFVETEAIKKISSFCNVIIYKRYIDDVFLLFAPKDVSNKNLVGDILNVFNSIDGRLQFTVEVPEKGRTLPFLDMQFAVGPDYLIRFWWYQKSMHSGFFMHFDAFCSTNTKWHFIINRFIAVFIRCNVSTQLAPAINFMFEQMIDNGYPSDMIWQCLRLACRKYNVFIEDGGCCTGSNASSGLRTHNRDETGQTSRGPRRPSSAIHGETTAGSLARDTAESGIEGSRTPATDTKRQCMLKLPFLSDVFTSKVKNLIHELELPLAVVQSRASQPKTLGFHPKTATSCGSRGCKFCTRLGDKFSCRTRGAVYKASCCLCGDEYIGMTNKRLKNRMSQHFGDLHRSDISKPLPAHGSEKHPGVTLTEEDFAFSVISTGREPVDTAICEALAIKNNAPAINRKFELTRFL